MRCKKNIIGSAGQKRQWVRLTRACNNRCLFCLDHEAHNGSMISIGDVRKRLEQGIQDGAERAVISGGEPTLHPEFIEIIRLARELGYEGVQVITNGRMFAYREFLRKCVEAGLGEITFSIHGNNEALHDELTQVPGSFRQTMSAVVNALEVPSLIVNADIVVNGKNVMHLPDIIARLSSLGIHEFDLLQVIPFGEAWENREKMLYDIVENWAPLKKTFELSSSPSLMIWTNRFPAEYLGDFPHLIQSPRKMRDDIFGRRALFEALLDRNEPLSCKGDRCSYCFLDKFCGYLDELIKARQGNEPVNVCVNLGQGASKYLEYISRVKVKDLLVTAPDWDSIYKSIECLPTESNVILDVSARTGQDMEVVARKMNENECALKIVLRTDLTPAFEMQDNETHFLVEMSSMTKHELIKNVSSMDASRVSLFLDNYMKRETAADNQIAVRQFLSGLEKFMGECVNVPLCMAGELSRPRKRFLPVEFLFEPCKSILSDLVDDFVLNHSYVKILKCRECREFSQCDGLHINYARNFGFEEIEPVQYGD